MSAMREPRHEAAVGRTHPAALKPASRDPIGHPLLRLQRAIGNRAVHRLVDAAIQPKLTINAPGDRYEQEADSVADQVMRMPATSAQSVGRLARSETTPGLQRCGGCGGDSGGAGMCAECEEEEKALHRFQDGAAPEVAPPLVHSVLRSPGRPLDPDVRAFMEPRFGQDFSQVRVHDDTQAAESARAVNALAYTVGSNVVFAHGQYSAHTETGRQLLAHELAHVVQQDGDSPIRLARQPPEGPTVAPTPEEQEKKDREERFKKTGWSQEWGHFGTWGWGAPETNNIYQDCLIAPLERKEFLDFSKLFPGPAGPHRHKPTGADDVLGLVHFDPREAKPPRIETVAVQDGKRQNFKLKPTHAEMPRLRSAYTKAGRYTEGTATNVDPTCKERRIRLGTGKFPIEWLTTPEGADKTREAEQEHCNDIRLAFDVTLGLYASAINRLSASEREYSSEESAKREATQQLGVMPDDMLINFYQMAIKTRLRDDREWHTAVLPTRKHRVTGTDENGCIERAVIDPLSWPEVGKHSSEEVLGMQSAPPGKSARP